MTDLKGTSRMTTSFTQPDDTDPRLQNMLTLYKQPATIRDMKQTYFYCGASSNLTNVDPIIHLYDFDILQYLPPGTNLPKITNLASIAKSYYYARIGTTRKLDISSLVNDLIDIRVPKDKYVVEINLAECTLEVDSEGWQNNPDFVIRYGPPLNNPTPVQPEFLPAGGLADIVNRDPTYQWSLNQSGAPGAENPPKFKYTSTLEQANKKTQPQTLHVRIRELSNGEPYNWSVTNSGSYSIDKGHQLLVRHGDVNYANLTLEFGHLGFIGNDQDYENFIRDPTQNSEDSREYLLTSNQLNGFTKSRINKFNYSDYKYFDYNSEIFNTIGAISNRDIGMYSSFAYSGQYQYPNAIYPKFYGGLSNDFAFGLPPAAKLITLSTADDNIERPANRPPFIFEGIRENNSTIVGPQPAKDQVYDTRDYSTDDSGYTDTPYLLQGAPLFYNQQVANIYFRFLIRIIHLF